MEPEYILAVDQSTSGTKGVLFDRSGRLVGRHTLAHRQYYPRPDWVEHDAEEIFRNTCGAVKGVLEKTGVAPDQVAALSISNQRETVVVWERESGRPIAHAVVWQCARARDICGELERQGAGETVRRKTGLVLSPYFSAAKIRWLLDNIPGARQKAENGQLLCGTVDAWLIFRLTGGRVHATDLSNASRTQLLNIKTRDWDDDLLRIFSIPRAMMPALRSSDDVFGTTDCGGVFPRPIPIAGVLGDSHAALFGQNCFEKGMAKATYGTGSSVMMNIGDTDIRSKNGLVTSIAWSIGGRTEYVFEGNINYAGATIRWLKDNLGLLAESRQSGEIASSVGDNGGVYMVPAFTGLGAPYWDSRARGLITGMTAGTTRAHIVRAAEESIAYQIRDIADRMGADASTGLQELRVDGGPTRDDFLMQFQADMLPCPVVVSRIEELSAAGAAFMGGLAVRLWADRAEISSLRRSGRTFLRHMDEPTQRRLYEGWLSAVRRARAPV